MRGCQEPQVPMLTFVDMDGRVPPDHPLRTIKALADEALRVDATVPPDLDVHLILDNYATHKTPAIQRWLARRPRYHLHFTPHQQLLAEPGGALVRGADREATAPRGVPQHSGTGASHRTVH